MTNRETMLRAARFDVPEIIPMRIHISAACWHHYPQADLLDIMAAFPQFFPNVDPSKSVSPQNQPWRTAGRPYTDSWGCVWETPENGITGAVVDHPLKSWDAFDAYSPPDPEQHNGWGPINWDRITAGFQNSVDRLKSGSLRHGHTFLTLSYIRGYENLIFDMADQHPKLPALIQMVEAFNAFYIQRFVELGAEWMGYPEDLGMQVGPMLSPDQFRTHIKPVYQRLMQPAFDAGCVVHMHSDGDIRDLAHDLLGCGIHVLNVQDLVNGIDWIRDQLKGRVCIDLDIDRQNITRFGTPDQIDAHIREAIAKLGSREGGLMITCGIYAGIPLENICALLDALARYQDYFSS
ncbi:MAG: uroporphyrinogen decarboxylase family protein [Candidatus Latescibacteria bacterium]|nr:uroporphyrinogen decarboxylase family protein [Candidatus Latescibacterota bacterium]